MSKLKQGFQNLAHEAHRYLQLARLTPASALVLPLAPMLGALVLAANGLPSAGATIGLLTATLSLWGIAWSFNDVINALHNDQAHSLILRGKRTLNQTIGLLVFFTLVILLDAFLLGPRLGSLAPLALLVAFTYPWLRKRTYLIDAWAGVGIAWTVPMAYAAIGHWPDKVGALLGVVTLLWATGWFVLYQWPRHATLMERGMRSLGHMFGSATGHLVIALQVTMLIGAWMAMDQAKLGSIYMYALVITIALIAWQFLLIHRKGTAGTAQALLLHVLAGACLWLGIAVQVLSAAA